MSFPKMEAPIPLCVPEIKGNEWRYIKDCLDTNWVSTVGEYVNLFERRVAEYTGRQFAVATVNGTAALHIALMVAGVEAEDEVLLPALTFVAPANAVCYLGAKPVFIDIEPDHYQMDISRVAQFLKEECRWVRGEVRNRQTGRKVHAVVPVHLLGHPVNMDPLNALANDYKLKVIEDATESLGAKYKNDMVGSAGDMSCFSFNGNKIITTGGGGMIVTDNRKWAETARHLTTQAKADPIEFIHDTIGYNYRLTNIQAAMGVAQMEAIGQYVERKREIAKTYDDAFEDIDGITVQGEAAWAESSCWLYSIVVDEKVAGISSRGLMAKLSDANIQTRPFWKPMHKLPYLKGYCPATPAVSEMVNALGLCLPCSVGLTADQQSHVIECIGACVEN